MSDYAIRVCGLGKKYRIGQRQASYETLRDTLRAAAAAPARVLRRVLGGSREATDAQANELWALDDVSFDVERGEAVGIVGRNGAGKSTLLKILSRITPPTTGQAVLSGRVGSLLEVGTGFHPELTGRENILLNGAILGMSRRDIQRQFDAIVEFAEVPRFIDTPVKHYSSGMYLRLAFAVAAHLEPEILIVDEVLAVGDAEFQKKCLGKMGEVARAGRTVLLVSHNMSAIQRLCGRTVLLQNGKLSTIGPTQAVLQEYLQVAGEGGGGERAWPETVSAPGDDVVRLRRVRALNARGEVSGRFGVRDAWQLEIEFDVLKEGQLVNVNVYVYDAASNVLFMVGDFQTSAWQRRPRPVGLHRSRCAIPADFLNEGMLRILVGLVTPPDTLRAMEEQALFLSILEDFSPGGSRGFYPAAWPSAAVRPLFQWNFDFVEPGGTDAKLAHSAERLAEVGDER